MLDITAISKTFHPGTPNARQALRQLSLHLEDGEFATIVGSNGAGKSTLLHLMAGELAPDSGTVEVGATVKIGHFSQEGRELDLNQRVYDFIHDIADEVRTDEGTFSANQMMERFLFPGDLQSVPIGRLSGGERRRLYLLSVLMEAPNVLLLDEPTNDLDVTTLSILEDYLLGFPGPILAVSHDRFFLDKLAESIFEVRGDGEIHRFTGNWTDWQAKRRAEEAPSPKAEKPKPAAERPRERKLKFTFKEQREFETIDADLAELEAQITACQTEQESCGSDYVKLQELQARQAELEAALEGVLFAAGEPVGVERLCLGLETDRPTLDAAAQRLMDRYRYERRGIRLLRLDASYQLCSAPEQADCIRRTLEGRKPARLSQPALEVLAIIAYYQPVTRAYVDQVRGVDSAYTVGLLLERELIEESGRLAVPGRPILYRTTRNFLRSFGLSSLEELPELPAASREGEQMALELEARVARLKAEEAGPEGPEPAGEREP